MNSLMLGFLIKPEVIKKPERAKKRLIPIEPAVAFNWNTFGPTGSKWSASTSRMLIARRPSSTGNFSVDNDIAVAEYGPLEYFRC
jgi:hypothetical protein